MTEVKNTFKSRKGIFRVVLTGLLVSCALTLLLLIIILVFNDGRVYSRLYRNELENNLQNAADMFSDIVTRYDETITELSENPEVKAALRNEGDVQSSKMHRVMNLAIKDSRISPQVHIIFPDKLPLVSTGFGDQRFDAQHYAIDILLDQTNGTLFHANHFYNNNNVEMVMTAARKINDGDECIGHVYFDMSTEELEEAFKQNSDLALAGQRFSDNFIICTWYNYTVFTQSSITDKLIASGGRYIDSGFLNPFKSESPVFVSQTISGVEYCLIGKQILDGKFVILYAVPMALLKRNSGVTAIVIGVMAFIIATFCLTFSLKIYRAVVNPVNAIITTMTEYENGNHEARCNFESANEMGLIRDQLNEMIERTNEMISNNEEKQKQLFIAEDNILKAQIKPHFINNLLDSIRWLVQMGETEEAIGAIKKLSVMLSGRLYSSDTETLGKSLEFIKNYIDVQRICYPDRINVSFDIDPTTLDVKVPSFILQPIVENAIVHGLQVKVNGGNLKICTFWENEEVIVTITDDGDGFDVDPEVLLNAETKGKGLGLYNVHRRLQLEYGSGYGLRIASIKDIGTTVKMIIPPKNGEEE